MRIDLHTHSTGSPDGGLTLDHIGKVLQSGELDVIAVTDHDSVATAQALQRELGGSIIVGEEITTADGELIGLYLETMIAPGQSARQTAEAIHAQGGLVYVPHPFEKLKRNGIDEATLTEMVELVDIVETYNARALPSLARWRARRFARKHRKAEAASSDAHGPYGLGWAYSTIKQPPTALNLVEQLESAQYQTRRSPVKAFFEPSRYRRARIERERDQE